MPADRSLALLRTAVRGSARSGLIAIEDVASIAAASETGVELLRVFVRRDAMAAELAWSLSVATVEVAAADYDEIFATTRRPAIVAVGIRPRPTTGRALAAREGDLVVLDGIRGPGNAGSVLRAAAAFRAAGVIAVGSGVDLYRRGVIRASCGAVFRTPTASMSATELAAFCERNDRSLIVATAHPETGTPVVDMADPRRWALVLGGETAGPSGELVARAAGQAHIEIEPAVESLNVSAAAAILLHQRRARTQHRSATSPP